MRNSRYPYTILPFTIIKRIVQMTMMMPYYSPVSAKLGFVLVCKIFLKEGLRGSLSLKIQPNNVHEPCIRIPPINTGISLQHLKMT